MTITAVPGEAVTLQPGGGSEVINLAAGLLRYLIFDGLVVDASGVEFGISLTNGASHIRFQGVEVKHARRSGVMTSTAGSGGHQFLQMRVHHNGSDQWDHGLYIQTSDNRLEDSEIAHNSGYGVHVFNGYGTPGERANNNVIRRNRIYANSTGSSAPIGGVTINSGDGNQFTHNHVYGNYRGLDVLWGNPRHTKICHNTFEDNPGAAAIEIGAGSVGAVVHGNLMARNGGEIVNHGRGTQLAQNGEASAEAGAMSRSAMPGECGSAGEGDPQRRPAPKHLRVIGLQ